MKGPFTKQINMTSRAAACVVLLALLPLKVSSTTWGEPTSVADPILKGAKCAVQEPMSSGSYIYHWPSKYDQVFWPLTDPSGIWFCRKSGFTAFIGDFELSAAERASLSAHLPQVYEKPVRDRPDIGRLLELLQQSYSQRQTSRESQIRLLRVLAYYNDAELQDYAAATGFRRQALAMIEEELLQASLEEVLKLEYLFVASAYYRELGEVEKSDQMLLDLETALRDVGDEKVKGYAEYLSSLKKDLSHIAPGGPLAPEPVSD